MNLFTQKDSMTSRTECVKVYLTQDEALAYCEALERALDNPFIQDDDECGLRLNSLLGHIEGSLPD